MRHQSIAKIHHALHFPYSSIHFFLSATPLSSSLCPSVVYQSFSLSFSAEMSLSFVTRLCSDWMVHPFSIWLTRLSRWRHPFIPAVQQSAPHCNPSLHPKHRCKGTRYLSCVHVHTVLMYIQTKKKKSTQSIHNCFACTHVNLRANTHCADITPSLGGL